MNDNRSYNAHYKKWRHAVVTRDKRCCQMPGCTNKRKLQAHHIRPWAGHIELRFRVDNGITLCIECHKKVKGNEIMFEALFTSIICSKDTNAFLATRMKLRNQE